VIGSAAVGALITALARSEPGLVLGVFLVGGTVIAGLAIQRRAVYRIIPVPALAYLVAAVLAGIIHDRANGTSGTALAVGATQWIASGFLAMSAATIVAIVLTVARWHSRNGGPPRPGGRPPAAGAGSSRRRQAAPNSAPPRSESRYGAPAPGRQRRDGMQGAGGLSEPR
jgi:hypothetical protein